MLEQVFWFIHTFMYFSSNQLTCAMDNMSSNDLQSIRSQPHKLKVYYWTGEYIRSCFKWLEQIFDLHHTSKCNTLLLNIRIASIYIFRWTSYISAFPSNIHIILDLIDHSIHHVHSNIAGLIIKPNMHRRNIIRLTDHDLYNQAVRKKPLTLEFWLYPKFHMGLTILFQFEFLKRQHSSQRLQSFS